MMSLFCFDIDRPTNLVDDQGLLHTYNQNSEKITDTETVKLINTPESNLGMRERGFGQRSATS